MHIKIGEHDAHHRIDDAKSITYRAGNDYPKVPRKIAEALISEGKAEEVSATTTEEEAANG